MIIEIEQEIKKRNITRLCHFVHTNVLLHILNNNEGVKAVDFISQDILLQSECRKKMRRLYKERAWCIS